MGGRICKRLEPAFAKQGKQATLRLCFASPPQDGGASLARASYVTVEIAMWKPPSPSPRHAASRRALASFAVPTRAEADRSQPDRQSRRLRENRACDSRVLV